MGKSKASKKRAKDVANDVNAAEVAMAKAVQRLQEIFREHSEQEIRAALLECNMNQNFAIDRLLSQQERSNEQGASTQLPDSSSSSLVPIVPSQSDLTNGETRSVPTSSNEAAPSLPVPSSSDVGETRTVPISSSEAVPPLSVPSSSDVTNGVTRSVPISSNEAAPSLPVPSSSSAITNGEARSVPITSTRPLSVPSSRPLLPNVKPKRQETRMISAIGPPMAEVLRGLHAPPKQNVTKAPLKADSPLKPDATNNPIFNSSTKSGATRNPQHSAFPMATMTSMSTDGFGTYPISEPHINNQQAMNRYNSLGQVPLEQYGNVMNSPYLWRQAQNERYNMPSSAPFQQRGGGSNINTLAHHGHMMMSSPHTWPEQDGTSIYESLNSVFAPYRNSTLPLSATSSVPTYHDSAYGGGMLSGNSRFGYEDVSRNHLPSNSSGGTSTSPSSHGTDYGFDMTSGNAANSRLGYEDISRPILPSRTSRVPSSHGSDYYGRDMSSGNGSNSRLGYEDVSRIHMPSIQGRSLFEWRVQGEDSYRANPPRSQQEREAYFERIGADLLASSLDQEYNTRVPSDQTQQRPRDK
ncbi:flocculation protein FLO11-like isoform X1 [Brassica napus]|uniref:flocculation protein FLO11-like isoform X1 n=1 Tax=Brassica napus TaxID=3708 RepID=UPI002078738A|nr:flocculation protein FLO11-like isoform X1 [Brassica napus]XP_048618343.1 flocculation protein FLO11-like isoform X1 [Brassica napus]